MLMRLFLLAAAALVASPASAEVPKPAALVADGIPAVPDELAARSRPYMEFRTAGFAGWNAADRSMLVSTRFGNVLYAGDGIFKSTDGGTTWKSLGDAQIDSDPLALLRDHRRRRLGHEGLVRQLGRGLADLAFQARGLLAQARLFGGHVDFHEQAQARLAHHGLRCRSRSLGPGGLVVEHAHFGQLGQCL